jgi:hypothetical protein
MMGDNDDEHRLDTQKIGGDCFLPGEVVLDIPASDLFLPETASIFFRYLPGSGAVQRK